MRRVSGSPVGLQQAKSSPEHAGVWLLLLVRHLLMHRTSAFGLRRLG